MSALSREDDAAAARSRLERMLTAVARGGAEGGRAAATSPAPTGPTPSAAAPAQAPPSSTASAVGEDTCAQEGPSSSAPGAVVNVCFRRVGGTITMVA